MALTGCSDAGGGDGEADATGSEDVSGNTSADASTDGSGDGSATSDSGESTTTDSDEGESGESTDTSGESTGDSGGDGDGPTPANLPSPTGACPTFSSDTLNFNPAGVGARSARVWVSDAANSLDGPIVFYWHAYTSQPGEAAFGLSQPVIDEILAQGGIVVAPVSDPGAGQFPWYQTGGQGVDNDNILADEILACAIQEIGIDTRHIHSVGMSAGGLQTSQFSMRRSNYIASAATYSGGVFFNPPYQDPSNKFAAMILHGGDNDVFGGSANFKTTSTAWHTQLTGNGNFAFLCDHGMGHNIPPGVGDDIWQFFQDHPYGTVDSPYASGLPSSFPAWCAL